MISRSVGINQKNNGQRRFGQQWGDRPTNGMFLRRTNSEIWINSWCHFGVNKTFCYVMLRFKKRQKFMTYDSYSIIKQGLFSQNPPLVPQFIKTNIVLLQLVKRQLGLIKKLMVKNAWVNSGVTSLPRKSCDSWPQ